MREIGKLLVANRGEIARRIFRSCRELGLPSVAVFSEPDRGEPFVREADEAVPLGGAAPSETYLDGAALVAAARCTGADAVHPGYGFLAESPAFARRCGDAGLLFVGPSPEVIAAMGSKTLAKTRMEKAGVPVVPSAPVSEEDRAGVLEAAATLGYPLLVKASAGGGGKGMRVVRAPEELSSAIASAQREALAAFGDDAVFLERYLEAPRHVEIQIFGDSHGRVVHLHERECSIQRRYQKIIEESPSLALDAALRAEMSAAAVAVGEALGYEGARTVEFLLDEERFFFLEVNTRLQVEHPVTESITGLDLVQLQLEVAQGAPLPRQEELPAPRGHAIEARLYAEDPCNDFLPSTGTVHRFEPAVSPKVRMDSGIESGSTVGIHYDPLLAKLVAHAPTRSAAAGRLSAALAGLRVHGLRTNRDLLVRILRHPEFLAGKTDTHFLARHPAAVLGAPLADADADRVHAAAAALAHQARRRSAAGVLASLPSGWRNNPTAFQESEYEAPSGRLRVGYRFTRTGLQLRVGEGEASPARLASDGADAVDLEWEGVRRRYAVHREGPIHYVDSALGASVLREVDRFPDGVDERDASSLVAPMPGVVREVRVAVGDRVEVGQVLLILEAMKMEHEVTADSGGRIVELRAREGEQVEAGRVLAVIEENSGTVRA
ncbi:MAG: biotin carboxylase N-terminal domain-containing protein [Myxococcota bacterium]